MNRFLPLIFFPAVAAYFGFGRPGATLGGIVMVVEGRSADADSSRLPRAASRVAVVGMAAAVFALGGLAIWSTRVTLDATDSTTQVSLQTAGQLRAMQSQSIIRTQTNALEHDYSEQSLAKLRAAQVGLPQALKQMQAGGDPAGVAVASKALQLQSGLDAKIEIWLADLQQHPDEEAEDRYPEDESPGEHVDDILTQLEVLLNDSPSDPATLLGKNLEKVTSSTRAVRNAAYVLVPFGLGGVLACAWLLSSYRRRSDTIKRLALEAMAREARTDQLTALANRRGLLEEVDRRVGSGTSFTLAIADLNGFKYYNDTFGHPAGDELLRRLGHKLAIAWQGHGFASRLGGDEFCVVSDDLTPEELQSVLQEALSEEGEGFSISAVSGLAHVPSEATDGSAALSLADSRLYAAKAAFHRVHGKSRAAAVGTSTESATVALAGLLKEHRADMEDRLSGMAELALACADRLGVPEDQRLVIECAARLHDIGKVAIPAAILNKSTPLSDDERSFVRRHAAIGERLIALNAALEPMARVVRAIHERWDGTGYPDQLVGETIPTGARIIAAVEAFFAMIGERPYAASRSVEDALAELRRCSGTQFDPAVVTALADSVLGGDLHRRSADALGSA